MLANELDSQPFGGEYLKDRSENGSSIGTIINFNVTITNNSYDHTSVSKSPIVHNDMSINDKTDPSTERPELVETVNVPKLMEEFEEINKNLSKLLPEGRDFGHEPITVALETVTTSSIFTHEMENDHLLAVEQSNRTTLSDSPKKTSLISPEITSTTPTSILTVPSTLFTFSDLNMSSEKKLKLDGQETAFGIHETTTEISPRIETTGFPIVSNSTSVILSPAEVSTTLMISENQANSTLTNEEFSNFNKDSTKTQSTTDSLYHPKFPGSLFTIEVTASSYTESNNDAENSSIQNRNSKDLNDASTTRSILDVISGKTLDLEDSGASIVATNQSGVIEIAGRNLSLDKIPWYHPKLPGSTFYVTPPAGFENRNESNLNINSSEFQEKSTEFINMKSTPTFVTNFGPTEMATGKFDDNLDPLVPPKTPSSSFSVETTTATLTKFSENPGDSITKEMNLNDTNQSTESTNTNSTSIEANFFFKNGSSSATESPLPNMSSEFDLPSSSMTSNTTETFSTLSSIDGMTNFSSEIQSSSTTLIDGMDLTTGTNSTDSSISSSTISSPNGTEGASNDTSQSKPTENNGTNEEGGGSFFLDIFNRPEMSSLLQFYLSNLQNKSSKDDPNNTDQLIGSDSSESGK